MSKIPSIFYILLFIFFSNSVIAKQVQFVQDKWSDILLQAKQQNKPIFVEFYASWCLPCNEMKNEVFANPEVAEYYNKNFISYRIDAEKEEQDLVKNLNIETYPTRYFFMPNGEIIGQQTGITEADDLLRFSKAMASLAQATDEVKNLRAEYQKNPQNREITNQYLQALVMSNQYEVAKVVANNYLNSIALEDWEKRYNWQLINNFVSDTESKGFQYILNNSEIFAQKYQADFTDYVLGVLQDELAQTTSKQDEKRLEKLKKMYFRAVIGVGQKQYEEKYYNNFIDLYYYKHSENTAKYYQILVSWVENYNTEDWQELSTRAFELSENKENSTHLEIAFRWAKRALQIENNVITNVTMAQVLANHHANKEALKYAEKALEINTEEDMTPYLERLIQKLQK